MMRLRVGGSALARFVRHLRPGGLRSQGVHGQHHRAGAAAAADALPEETDVQLARDAAPASLKTVEGFLVSAPKNRDLLASCWRRATSSTPSASSRTTTSRSPDDAKHADERDALAARATGLYDRAHGFAIRLLELDDKHFGEMFRKDVASAEAEAKKLDKKQAPGLLFTGLALASAINLNRNDLARVVELPKAIALIKRSHELDPKFYNGGAAMTLGIIYCSQGKAIGGDPELGQEVLRRGHRRHRRQVPHGEGDVRALLRGHHAGSPAVREDAQGGHRGAARHLAGAAPAERAGQEARAALPRARRRLLLGQEILDEADCARHCSCAVRAAVRRRRRARAQTTLKIATLAPEGSAWMVSFHEWAKNVEEHTGGKIKIKFFAGGTAGDERDAVRKMRLGQLNGAAVTAIGLGLINSEVRVLELPMLINTYDELDFVRNKLDAELRKKFDDKGYVLLAWGDVGPVHIFSNIADQGQSRPRADQAVGLGRRRARARRSSTQLGVNGVPLGVPDVLPSLQTGLINACYGSPLSTLALQWYTKVKYMTSMHITQAIGATVITKKEFDKLDAGRCRRR